jgi:hypothetical protein
MSRKKKFVWIIQRPYYEYNDEYIYRSDGYERVTESYTSKEDAELVLLHQWLNFFNQSYFIESIDNLSEISHNSFSEIFNFTILEPIKDTILFKADDEPQNFYGKKLFKNTIDLYTAKILYGSLNADTKCYLGIIYELEVSTEIEHKINTA